ncbi:MAG: zinc-ribbon and DUF3426 domain-containing protein [Candidatus Wenzhouxiangella sp. M2_3B_020]
MSDVAYTRCDHCDAVLPVRYPELGQAGGMVRCGSCGRTLNALARLYTSFPGDDGQSVKPSGMPPMLQPHVEQERMLEESDPDGGEEGDTEDTAPPVLHLDLEPDPPPAWSRWIWPILGVLLIGLLAVQLFGPERWRVDVDWLEFGETEPVPIADAVQLVSRDMHPHPSLDDAFVISAVLVNRAGRSVPWPNIELKLFDASQQMVGRRRLAPREYLSEEADIERGFAPDVRLPVVLEMAVGSSRPAGFSMSFYY